MSTVNSTQIRIELGVKSDLEVRRDLHGRKTHSDTIALLIDRVSEYENDAEKRYAADRQEEKRKSEQDLNLGAARKKRLADLQEQLNLDNLNQVVDLLLHHFESSDAIRKETLIYARLLTK